MVERADSSFEDHLKALERVVADLEGDSLSLESSIGRYKEGVSHLAACRKILDAAEQRLCELVTTPGGVEEVPLRVGPEGLQDATSDPSGDAGTPRPAKPRKDVVRSAAPKPTPPDDLPF